MYGRLFVCTTLNIPTKKRCKKVQFLHMVHTFWGRWFLKLSINRIYNYARTPVHDNWKIYDILAVAAMLASLITYWTDSWNLYALTINPLNLEARLIIYVLGAPVTAPLPMHTTVPALIYAYMIQTHTINLGLSCRSDCAYALINACIHGSTTLGCNYAPCAKSWSVTFYENDLYWYSIGVGYEMILY